jgi:hypothetical protein
MSSRTIQWLRWLPFVALTALSLSVAGGLPHARKPFEVDISVSSQALLVSLGKWSHYKSTALHFVLAVVAVGVQRPVLATGLAFLVGIGWELVEITAVGHHARLADLAPDLGAALACLAVLLAIRSGAGCRRRWRAGRKRSGAGPTAE